MRVVVVLVVVMVAPFQLFVEDVDELTVAQLALSPHVVAGLTGSASARRDKAMSHKQATIA